MKKWCLFLLTLGFFLSRPAQGQTDAGQGPGLTAFTDGLKLELMKAKMNQDCWRMKIQEYPPSSSQQVVVDLRANFGDSSTAKPRENTPAEEVAAIKKYSARFDSLFSAMHLVGGELALFGYERGWVPVRVLKKDDKSCYLLSAFLSGTVYNTLRTTSNSRAKKVLTSLGTDLIGDMYEHLSGSGITCCGVVIAYASKNFLDESSVMNERSEAVCLVSTLANAKSFAHAEITETEFLAKSDIYLSDRDMVAKFKKIDIKDE